MVLRIQRFEGADIVIFMLSGRISAEPIEVLKKLLGAEVDRPVVLDLTQVDGIDDDGVGFLVRCESRGMTLANCPAYIREWIRMEKTRSSLEGHD
jgi:hypothetical protein